GRLRDCEGESLCGEHGGRCPAGQDGGSQVCVDGAGGRECASVIVCKVFEETCCAGRTGHCSIGFSCPSLYAFDLDPGEACGSCEGSDGETHYCGPGW